MKKKVRSHAGMHVVTSCVSTTLVLLLLGTVVFFVMVGMRLGDTLRENFSVTVMLDDNMSNRDAYALQQQLRANPGIKKVAYISKEKALAEQTRALGTDPTEFLGSNPMPASFELHLNADYANSDSLSRFIPQLKRNPYVVEVTYPHELMESINNNIRKVSIVMLIVALLLTVVSFELINNTIRLSIYSRRFLIHTMKLVGASWGFIRRPFILRAFWIGVLSATLAGIFLIFGIYAIMDYEQGMTSIITPQLIAVTLGVVYACGISLTLICAYFSVNKHLRANVGKLYMM